MAYPAIDRLVGSHVMGWTRAGLGSWEDATGYHDRDWSPTSDWAVGRWTFHRGAFLGGRKEDRADLAGHRFQRVDREHGERRGARVLASRSVIGGGETLGDGA
jgi:hypothetical protein